MHRIGGISPNAAPVIVSLLSIFILGSASEAQIPSASKALATTAEVGNKESGRVLGSLGLRCSPRLHAVPPSGVRALTISVTDTPVSDLTVNLAADNPAIAGVPATVIIPAGQTSTPVPVMGIAAGATFITANIEAERSTCSVYVADRLTDPVVRFPAASLRVRVGSDLERPEPPKLALPLRVMVLPVPFGVTQPVKVEVRSPE